MKILNLLLTFILFAQVLSAQTTESGDLVASIGTLIDNMPGDTGDDYVAPTNAQLTTWESCLLKLIQKKYGDAELIANQLAYDLVQFTDNSNNQPYYILRSQTSSDNLWGTYIFNPRACQSNLVIQAPHPRNDSNTGDQGIYILKDIGALFYMVAGTHRCNSDSFSSCSGTTKTCDNGSEPYRESDMAHIDQSIFHKTTELLLDKLADPYFVRLHGFTKGTDDPYLILSNGTTAIPTIDYLTPLGDALVDIDPTLDYKVAHITPSIRLKGTTNTQGRLINGSVSPCGTAASVNSGRFLHIEQEKSKLRADATGWQKMADALKVVFRNLDLASTTLHLENYTAYDTINAQNTIPTGTTAHFTSNQLIHLDDGFHAEQGSLFIAKIDGCPPSLPLQANFSLEAELPNTSHQTMQIAPNPFLGQTTISYQLDRPQRVTLAVYNTTGQLVERLLSDVPQAADVFNYTFRLKTGLDGIFFVSLRTGDGVLVEKVMVLR